jgi:hypothetical protein
MYITITHRDREFFYRAYCRHDTPEHRARIQSQLALVRRHRESTIHVLGAIAKREQALAKVQKVVTAISQQRSTLESSFEPPTSDTSFIEHLLELRESTARVVTSIESWRQDMWRPQPFVWKGINYLIKVSNDTSFFLENYNIAALHAAFGFKVVDRHFFVEPEGKGNAALVGLHLSTLERDRLNDLAKVVMVEHALQREVYSESKRLLKVGYYIPLLRWSPDDEVVMGGTSGLRKGHENDTNEEGDLAGENSQGECKEDVSAEDASGVSSDQVRKGNSAEKAQTEGEDERVHGGLKKVEAVQSVEEKKVVDGGEDVNEDGYSNEAFSDGEVEQEEQGKEDVDVDDETKALLASAQHKRMLQQVRDVVENA